MKSSMPAELIEQRVLEAVAKALDLRPAQVSLSDSLRDDLDAESLDYLDIVFQLEREFKVQFPRNDLLQRASEHFGEEALVKDDVVTDLGLEVLRRGMNEIGPEHLRPGLRASEITGLFTVRTFVRVLDRLLAAKEQMSRVCADCGGVLVDSPSLPELVCAGCNRAVPLPAGDAVLLQDLLQPKAPGEPA
ncbi:MAG: acyl carrier protein [Thermoanaerobaculia bacterium]